MLRVVLLVVCVALMLIGTAGTVLPGVPGMPVVLLGVVVYALALGVRSLGVDLLIVATVLTLASLILDYLAVAAGAGITRASRLGVLGALAGGIVGLVLGGWAGLALGIPVGAILGEVAAGRSVRQGFRVAMATVIATAGTALLKLAMAGTVLVMFLMRVT